MEKVSFSGTTQQCKQMVLSERVARRLKHLYESKSRGCTTEVLGICNDARHNVISATEACALIGTLSRNTVRQDDILKKCCNTLKQDPRGILNHSDMAAVLEGCRLSGYNDYVLCEILSQQLLLSSSNTYYDNSPPEILTEYIRLSGGVKAPVLQHLLLTEVLPKQMKKLSGTDLATIAFVIIENDSHVKKKTAVCKVLLEIAQTVISKEVVLKTVTVEEWSFLLGMLSVVNSVEGLDESFIDQFAIALLSQLLRPSQEASLILYSPTVVSSIALVSSRLPASLDLKNKIINWSELMLKTHFANRFVPPRCVECMETAKQNILTM